MDFFKGPMRLLLGQARSSTNTAPTAKAQLEADAKASKQGRLANSRRPEVLLQNKHPQMPQPGPPPHRPRAPASPGSARLTIPTPPGSALPSTPSPAGPTRAQLFNQTLSFSIRHLVLKQSKKISIVNLPFPCAIMTSQLRCRSLTLDLR